MCGFGRLLLLLLMTPRPPFHQEESFIHGLRPEHVEGTFQISPD